MARKTTTTTAATTATTTLATKGRAKDTRRVTSLEPRASQVLTSLEESVVRMHHGISLKPQAELSTNGVTDELMGQLFEMEVRAHVESGRVDGLPDVPAAHAAARHSPNARTAKVVAELKKKQ